MKSDVGQMTVSAAFHSFEVIIDHFLVKFQRFSRLQLSGYKFFGAPTLQVS